MKLTNEASSCWLAGGTMAFFCDSKDQVGVEMCLKNWIEQYVKVGYDPEPNVYAELSLGTDFDPKQLESLKRTRDGRIQHTYTRADT